MNAPTGFDFASISERVQSEVQRAIQRSIKGVEYFSSSGPELGSTPKDVLYSRGTMNLYHYRPQADEVYRVPVLIVMATTNRGYILDLVPGQSFIEFLLKRGFDVYMLDWTAPKPEEKSLRMDAYGLKVAKVGRAERARRRDEALEMVRLPGYAERRPGELSGGQRQRVALARAIVNRPRVLLLDEPLGALDLKLREQMQTELKTIQREVGITFVYVTHDQDEALTMSDRIAVFNKGRIEQVSPPLELYEHPASEFVAGFVGVSNLIERDGERMTIRPEKIELLEPGAATDGLHTETGHVVDVAYSGMVTRFTVQLDSGEKLQLVKQNVESASAGALPEQGNEVLVGWRPEHAAALGEKSTKQEVAQ